ncbi:MAG TPA: DUF4399 domain-containing protein [Polyangiales bacterium]|nr:DUF4399 domain-containing protein [Polyangiales bacterium]
MLISLFACNKPAEPAASNESEPAVPVAPAAAPTVAPTPAAAEDHVHPTAEVAAAIALPAVPAGAKVSFVAPRDGEKITGPLENGKVSVKVQMGAEGIAIKPAGAVETGSGHHHILIDAEPIAPGTVVPKDDTHLHFGQGQTEANVALAIGEHTLTMQLADGIHRSYGPALSSTIKINVTGAGTVGAIPTLGSPIKPAN